MCFVGWRKPFLEFIVEKELVPMGGKSCGKFIGGVGFGGSLVGGGLLEMDSGGRRGILGQVRL
jgi:hypothetical protein